MKPTASSDAHSISPSPSTDFSAGWSTGNALIRPKETSELPPSHLLLSRLIYCFHYRGLSPGINEPSEEQMKTGFGFSPWAKKSPSQVWSFQQLNGWSVQDCTYNPASRNYTALNISWRGYDWHILLWKGKNEKRSTCISIYFGINHWKIITNKTFGRNTSKYVKQWKVIHSWANWLKMETSWIKTSITDT